MSTNDEILAELDRCAILRSRHRADMDHDSLLKMDGAIAALEWACGLRDEPYSESFVNALRPTECGGTRTA